MSVEVVIDLEAGTTPFGPIGDPPTFVAGRLINQVAPVVLVLARDVGAALIDGGDDSYGGVVVSATPDGMFRVDSVDGSWIWELFPACFSVPWRDDPAVYIAVWRD